MDNDELHTKLEDALILIRKIVARYNDKMDDDDLYASYKLINELERIV